MKSFKHFYNYITLEGFGMPDGPIRVKELTVRGKAPVEMPDHVAKFLIQRLANRWIERWPKESWMAEKP